MRDRLIELLDNAVSAQYDGDNVVRSEMDIDDEDISIIADHLLANGVIVLPLEIGDTVYCLAQPCGGCNSYDEPLTEASIEQCRKCDLWEVIQCGFDYDLIPEYGKLVFSTKEEAEKALAEKLRKE